MHGDGRQVLRGNRRGPHVGPFGNDGGLKRRMVDLHCGRVRNGKKPYLSRLHQLRDGWIPDGAHAEDRIGLSVEECLVPGFIAYADEVKIPLMQAKVFGHAQKRSKLSSRPGERNPLASQIHDLLQR